MTDLCGIVRAREGLDEGGGVARSDRGVAGGARA